MKGIVFEIKRFAVHDGDGIRTTVFLKGCPLKCVWCHNPEGIGRNPELAYYEHKCIGCGACVSACPNGAHSFHDGKHSFDRTLCTACGKCEDVCLGTALTLYGKEMTADEVVAILLEDRDFYESSGGGITLSGGECLMQADFCAEILRLCKEQGLHTAVDTCGFVPRTAIDKVLLYTDIFLYDLKAFDGDVHVRCTGLPNQKILENLVYIDKQGKDIEIRMPYVPDYNDAEVKKINAFLRQIGHLRKLRVLPYHSYAASKYAALGMENTLPARTPEDVEIADAKAKFSLDCPCF